MRLIGMVLAVAALGAAAGAASAADFEVKMLNKGAEGAMVFEPSFVQVQPGDVVHFVADRQGPRRRERQGDASRGRRAVQGQDERGLST